MSFCFRDQEEDATQEEDFPKKMQEKLSVFKDIFPDNIVCVESKKAYSGKYSTGSVSYELQVSPHVKDTWHELPVVDGSTEAGSTEVSNWSMYAEKDSLPKLAQRGPTNVVPKDYARNPPRDMLPMGVKVCFDKQDKEYENFLSGPALVKDSKMFIDGPAVNGPTHIKVKLDKNVVKAEMFARCGIRESEGVTGMLEMLSDRLKEIGNNPPEDLSYELELTREWLSIVLLSSFRTSAYLQSIQVMTKDSVREVALDNLTGSVGSFETKKDLRHSHYATQKVFGPLSSEFEQYLLPSSQSHKNFKLAPIPSARVTSGQRDRNGPSTSTPSSRASDHKRPYNSNWDSPNSKRSKQSDNFVKSISAHEALRRLKGNSGKQNQFFRNQGKGKRPNYPKRK